MGERPASETSRELESLLDAIARLTETALQEAAPGSPVQVGLTRIGEVTARARDLVRQAGAPPRRAPPAEAPAAPAPARAPAVPRGDERVLLVEDEPMVRSAHRRLLSSLGYQVTAVADGQEAMQLLRDGTSQFDLVLTDQTMPRVTGIELARLVRAERPGLPVILCSGFSDSPEEASAADAGVAASLQKPVDRASLASLIRQVLDARQGAAPRP